MADMPIPVDINQASLDELGRVPGMGLSLAEKVIAGRPFDKVDDLVRVNGIGKKSLVPMLPYLTASPLNTQPVEPSESGKNESPVDVEEKAGASEGQNPANSEKITAEILADFQASDNRLVENQRMQGSPVVPVSTNLLVFPGALNHQPESGNSGAGSSSTRALPDSSPKYQGGSGTHRPGINLESAGLMIGIGLLAWILGVVFSLGIMRLVNGTLSYPNANLFNALQVKVDSMGDQLTSIRQDVDSLRTRMDGIEALSGRISSVEEKARAIEDEMKTTRDNITRLQEENKQLKDQVSQLQEKSTVFQRFLDGMRSLFAGLFPGTPAQ